MCTYQHIIGCPILPRNSKKFLVSKCTINFTSHHHHLELFSVKNSVIVLAQLWVLLKEAWKPVATDLPQIVEPPGLSADRQWYLYEKIRPFCDEDFKDITCPLPLVPRPNRTPVTTPLASPVSSPSRRQSPFHRPAPLHNTETSEQHTGTNPPAKRARICTNCGVPGHNRRTCKQ